MSIVERISWSVLFLFGVFVIYASLQIKYYGSDFGPRPGLFSFWLGVLVVALSVIEIGRTFGKRVPLPADFFPPKAGVARIACLLGALMAVVLLLTRLGYNSKTVITGDITQIDLPPHKYSGLVEARHALKKIEGIAVVELTRRTSSSAPAP